MPADSQHLEILRRGPRSWNEWRAQNPSLIPHLIGLSLTVGERQLGPINGGPINFASARLRHANLRFATLSAANLETADLSDADLCDARLDGADLSGADLSDALLERVDFARANLAGANLCGASLKEARNLTQDQIEAAIGDAFTLLPPHLSRPHAWTISQVVSSPRGFSAPPVRELPGQARAEAGERMSWLVGGPRSANVAPRSDTPQRDPHGA